MELRLTRWRILIAFSRTLAGLGAQLYAPDDPRNGSQQEWQLSAETTSRGASFPVTVRGAVILVGDSVKKLTQWKRRDAGPNPKPHAG